ncbi:MAG: histidine kinase [Saprospiraceae bacterium]|nr:histidine kinase [Saprospiraceae bacterium]
MDQRNGLSSHYLVSITPDSSGFLWIGSRAGLNRFDGNQFRIFKHDPMDSTSLLHNYCQYPYVDRNGQIWVGYAEGGLSKYIPYCQCFEHYDPFDSLSERNKVISTYILLDDQDGNLWFNGKAMIRFNPKTKKLDEFPIPELSAQLNKEFYLDPVHVSGMIEISKGKFWVSTTMGLYYFDVATKEFIHKPAPMLKGETRRYDFFSSIVSGPNETLWFPSWGSGLSKYDIKTGEFKNYRYSRKNIRESLENIVYSIAVKNDHELWLATGDRSLAAFDIRTEQFSYYNHPSIDPELKLSNNVWDVLVTKDKTMFLGIDQGLLRYNPLNQLFYFQNLTVASSQNKEFFGIEAILEDPNYNAIYFGTSLGNGLNLMDTKTGKLSHFDIDIRSDNIEKFTYVLDIDIDQKERMWVTTRDYLYEFDRKRRKISMLKDPMSAGEYNLPAHFSKMVENLTGELWVLTEEGGLHQFYPDQKKLSKKFNDRFKLSGKGFQHLLADRLGRIWLFGHGELFVMDMHGKIHKIILSEKENKWLEDGLRGTACDSLGRFWMVTKYKGLLCIDFKNDQDPVFRYFGTEQGLPADRSFSMGSDHNGNLWIANVGGVIYFNSYHYTARTFSHTSGIEKNTIQFRFINSQNDAFYMTAYGRYCKIDFAKLQNQIPMPKVYIDQFNVLNEDRDADFNSGNALRIAANENLFAFDFGCIDLSDQSQNQFAYRLEGWDKDWNYCGSRRYASYTNLKGGHYTFFVKAANREGIWGDAVSQPVFIETPFYQKTWFTILMALVLSLVIYGIYIFRIRQIEHTESIRTEFNRQLVESRMEALRAQMNPHFIFNCLNSINRYIIKSDIKTSSLYLTKFAKLIRLIMDNSRNKLVILTNELDALKLYIEMEALRFDNKFSYEIKVDPNVETDHIEIPPLIIQPYVENAIWHGLHHKESGGILQVMVSMKGENLRCEIRDNGIGRKKAEEYKAETTITRKSIGMKLTEERLKFSGGLIASKGSQEIIDLFDDGGQAIGTSVVLTIPI